MDVDQKINVSKIIVADFVHARAKDNTPKKNKILALEAENS